MQHQVFKYLATPPWVPGLDKEDPPIPHTLTHIHAVMHIYKYSQMHIYTFTAFTHKIYTCAHINTHAHKNTHMHTHAHTSWVLCRPFPKNHL